MSRRFARWCLALLASIAVGYGQTEELIPHSKLRPGDPAQFFPNAVKLTDEDLAQIEYILVNRLNRVDLAEHLQKNRSVPELPRDFDTMAALIDAPSKRVKEWTLRTLGEGAADNAGVVPLLRQLVFDGDSDREVRALAARVLGTTAMDVATISALIDALQGGDKELRVIFLEVIAKAGSSAVPSLGALQVYLNVPEACVQFHTFRAMQQIERAVSGSSQKKPKPPDSPHYAKARDAATFCETRDVSPESVRSSSAVVKDPTAPKYLVCLGLLHLSLANHDPQAIAAVLHSVADKDEFVAALAANVLNSFERFDRPALEVLSRALSHPSANVRLQAAFALRKCGPGASLVLGGLVANLERASTNGAAPGEVGACLDALRNVGTNAAQAAPVVMRLLEERSPVYRNLNKHDVDHLRAFLLVTLAEVGVPKEGLALVVGSLSSGDRWMTLEFAGAARAAGALGTNATQALPLLLRPLQEAMRERPITFERFDSHVSSAREYTTCRAEVLRALRKIGPAAQPAVAVVRAFLDKPLPIAGNSNALFQAPDLRREAEATLAAIEAPRVNTIK